MSTGFYLEFYCSICGAPFSSPESLDQYKWLNKVKLANRSEYTYVVYDYRSYAFYQPDKHDKPNLDKPVLYVITYDECECVHYECWKLNNKSFNGVASNRGDPLLAPYQTEEYFNYNKIKQDGKDWMLEDPSCNSKNKRRIISRIKTINKLKKPTSKKRKSKPKKVNPGKSSISRPSGRYKKHKLDQYAKMSKAQLVELILKEIKTVKDIKTLQKTYNMLTIDI